MAVKAALQLGLHSPVSYGDHGVQRRELRKRVWFAVVNQDRYISIALGRPCLIVPEHNRVERLNSPVPTPATIMNSISTGSLIYYKHLTYTLHR